MYWEFEDPVWIAYAVHHISRPSTLTILISGYLLLQCCQKYFILSNIGLLYYGKVSEY